MNETVIQAAALIVPLIFAIVFHEVAHGLMARRLAIPPPKKAVDSASTRCAMLIPWVPYWFQVR